METRKLEKEEVLDDFEKLLIACGSIPYEAEKVRQVTQNRQLVMAMHKKSGEESLALHFENSAKESQELLKEVLSKIREAREMLIDFTNGCDMVSAIDCQLGAPVYNALNDLVVVDEDGEDYLP
jgi:formate-dependent nitrite reductase cytochrome c552 subunit